MSGFDGTLTWDSIFNISFRACWTRNWPFLTKIRIVAGSNSISTWDVYPDRSDFLLDSNEERTPFNNIFRGIEFKAYKYVTRNIDGIGTNFDI